MSRETQLCGKHFCILSAILPAQLLINLVYIKKKLVFETPYNPYLPQKCQLAVLFSCIEHEISKVDSSLLKKIFAKKTLHISSIVVN